MNRATPFRLGILGLCALPARPVEGLVQPLDLSLGSLSALTLVRHRLVVGIACGDGHRHLALDLVRGAADGACGVRCDLGQSARLLSQGLEPCGRVVGGRWDSHALASRRAARRMRCRSLPARFARLDAATHSAHDGSPAARCNLWE